MLNTATVLISDIIGNDSENSAFVYGSFGLFDKCANGFIVFLIVSSYSDDIKALKLLMSFVPTLCSVFCFIFAFMGDRYYSDKLATISESSDGENESEMVGFGGNILDTSCTTLL